MFLPNSHLIVSSQDFIIMCFDRDFVDDQQCFGIGSYDTVSGRGEVYFHAVDSLIAKYAAYVPLKRLI